MAQRILKGALQRRLYGSVASAPKAPAKPLVAGAVQVDKANNGIKMATQENNSALARVVCAVKAGSRYEDSSQRGVSHCLRVATDLTQKETRAFYLVKALQQMGGNITCTSSREHLIYSLEVPRDCVNDAMPFFTGMVSSQSFRPWELNDVMPRLECEITSLDEQPDKRVVESLHYAAYREGGLGRSLYAPMFQLMEFSPDLLREYVTKNFSADRMSLSATGVDMSSLQSAAQKLSVEGSAGDGKSSGGVYAGGEIREKSEDLLAYTILAAEGASTASGDLWAFAVLEQILGAGPHIKWASNTTSNRLNTALATKTQDPYHAQAFNVNYSDSGLFGVSTVTVPENSEIVIRSVMDQLNEISAKPIDANTLEGAKSRVTSSVAFQAECSADAVQCRAVDLLNQGEVRSLDKTLQSIKAVNASAVQKAAQKVLAGKLTMASVGEIQNVPYVDQLKK